MALKMTEDEKNKKRKRQQIAIYGNYKSYYGYRIDHKLDEDPRLRVLRKEWFEGKDCLDIGCNQGLITICIAKKFNCRSILGIDIDASLIDCALVNLRTTARKDASRSTVSSKGELSKRTEDLELWGSLSASNGSTDSPKDLSTLMGDLLQRVDFRTENFVESSDVCSEKYDTIICFSVTKWIHLNWGDDGLITLFVKIWKLLRPGGVLVLEPQPWQSYRNKRRVSEGYWYLNIPAELLPGVFVTTEMLRLGLEQWRKLQQVYQAARLGSTGQFLPLSNDKFNRPRFCKFKRYSQNDKTESLSILDPVQTKLRQFLERRVLQYIFLYLKENHQPLQAGISLFRAR